MEEPLMAIIDAIKSVIERTPPELIDDIITNGIVMTGGGSMLCGIDRLVSYYTGIRVRIPKNPMDCVALGTGRSLENISRLPTSIIGGKH